RRIRHRHDERGAGARDRDDLVLFADLAADELDDVGLDLVLVEVDRRQPVLRREEARDLAVRDVSELRERVAEVLAGLFLLFLRRTKLLQADQLFTDEELTESFRGHRAGGATAEDNMRPPVIPRP